MCGFAGILERGTDAGASRLAGALDCLQRRGPDGGGREGETVAGWRATFGHRRLAIIDLDERAAQPFRRGALLVAFNGELYNYVELRDELRAAGAEFRTESDTEVVCAAWERWGGDALARFDGMYALAVLDRAQRTLTLARDAFGEKPLFVAASPDRVVFGSTMDAVLALLGTPVPAIDPAWVEAFTVLGFAPAPLTMRRGVEKLAAGERRTFVLADASWRTAHDGAVALLDRPRGTRRFDAMEFEERLTTSLERRLRADVPLALLLSGGIDSAYVAALARRRLGRELLAVTIRDRVDSSVEVDRARRTCEALGVAHRVVDMPDRPLREVVAASLAAMDEPIGDPAFPMLVELFAHVPPDLRVVLTGDGADELFLSYSSYRRLLGAAGGAAGSAAAVFAGPVGALAPRLAGPFGRRVAERVVFGAALAPGDRFRRLAALAGWGRADGPAWSRAVVPRGAGPEALWRHSLAYELPEYLLVKGDRASMHQSFEARTPYLSRDVLAYVLECDPASVGLGRKEAIVARLEAHLGAPLGFTKRGFFASGQDLLARGDDAWHPALRDHPIVGPRLAAAADPRRTDALAYYRLHVLNSWLQTRCA
jgi:asparagine synthase (glutamine-hydrolysing)